MNEVEEGMSTEAKMEMAAAEEEIQLSFSPNCCFVAPQQHPSAQCSALAGHGGTLWREAESKAPPKWQQQYSIRRFCGREMVFSLGANNQSASGSLLQSGQQGHVNLRFLGALGQQQQQQSQLSVNLGNSSSSNNRSRSGSLYRRSKRIRTTFGRSQLDTLRECFKRSHKPNSTQLCTLVHRTGLSKRVIQVWFQNQRSKWLRHMFERYSSGCSSSETDAAAAAAAAATIGPHIVQPAGPLGELFADDLCLCLPPSMSAMRTSTTTTTTAVDVDAVASSSHCS